MLHEFFQEIASDTCGLSNLANRVHELEYGKEPSRVHNPGDVDVPHHASLIPLMRLLVNAAVLTLSKGLIVGSLAGASTAILASSKAVIVGTHGATSVAILQQLKAFVEKLRLIPLSSDILVSTNWWIGKERRY
jgi:hypothetical protein